MSEGSIEEGKFVRSCDFVFLFDLVSISPPCLESLHAAILRAMGELFSKGRNQLGDQAWRLKACGYHPIDPANPDATWWVEHTFTRDLGQFRDDLGAIVSACRSSAVMSTPIASDDQLVILLDGEKFTTVSVDTYLGKPHFRDRHPDALFMR